jgi:hypothetical protein
LHGNVSHCEVFAPHTLGIDINFHELGAACRWLCTAPLSAERTVRAANAQPAFP